LAGGRQLRSAKTFAVFGADIDETGVSTERQRATIVGKSKSLFFVSASLVAALHCCSVA
jgi:hypothetical protein